MMLILLKVTKNFLLSLKQKTRLVDYFANITMETILMNTEHSKKPTQKRTATTTTTKKNKNKKKKKERKKKFSIYHKQKNIRQQYINHKLKTIYPRWNDEFDLPNCCYSVSDIQDYLTYINRKHEELPTNQPSYLHQHS